MELAGHSLFNSFFLIFSGAALITTLALYTRQPLLVAYIVLGAVVGPYGLGYLQDMTYLSEMANIGIIFLLFLLGLDLQPKALLATLKQSSFTAFTSSLLFALVGYGVGRLFGFPHRESLVIGAAMVFSSTIIGIKLLPTTVLHHRHTGELMIGLLLIQDVIAILVLMVLFSGDLGQVNLQQFGMALLILPFLAIGAIFFVKYILLKPIEKFDHFHEYIFLLAIGWCLGLAQLAHSVGLSIEIGAFIAGISLATCPIAQFIAINLKPLRDFFLIMFFFSVGAQLNLLILPDVILPSLMLCGLVICLKPPIFRYLLHKQKVQTAACWDIAFRLGQNSEFSLLIAFVAFNTGWITEEASLLIQTTAILSILISSYIIIYNFPNPLAASKALRRD